ncbi:MAG: IPT/TIG domain-containing protein [Nitrospira sp.]|uniref:IPT/TIG domain-containing protein n=1 Tax=Nitrospira sp. ND1 TaxID=1658518 RepID=UPI00135655A0|nr:IPT/TIG domain-containing protein [Nitrospira sp. ND1]MBK7421362.1 IPT/TIG domain-containing protein [Nitrospira sp.]MBK7486182.1 IPT/TIG domain-containing protein [Nitrospira sp.]MBK8377960.1 IPT/TIG domain-containing protein [Nitrospira sp.]MBK9996446.1 IPT/TIG domain-containing protein [Nitrospira sp.]MBP6198107.1 IPT/TIG domain-containing protein [Nitrospira sp.]
MAMCITLGFASFLPDLDVFAQQITSKPDHAPPGATVVLRGKGLGSFKSARFNRVTFAGVPALIQRWESDLVEVKVPFTATTGPIEMLVGKKRLSAGTFTVVTPHISSLTPRQAERGTILTIIGEHFGETAGGRDPNTMFGVNDVVIGGGVVRPQQWTHDRIEVEIPSNAVSGDVVVRLASSDPLPDGSCCRPAEYVLSNAVSLSLIPTVRVDPLSGPVGTKVVLFGQGFGADRRTNDAVLIAGQPATIAQWKDDVIVVHVPLGAKSGPVTIKSWGRERTVAHFTVHTPKVTNIAPASAPIGTLLRISGEHFGFYSENGATPYNFMDFNTGENRVEIGGVPAVIYRWDDDRIDAWVPFSAKSGKVVVYRNGNKPNPDGSCCLEQGGVATEAGEFALVTPVIESYQPTSAGLDEVVTIKGRGFGSFLKTAEHTHLGINQKVYKRGDVALNETEGDAVVSNVSRTEVLFNGIAAIVESWGDTQIVVRVPHRNLYGVGKKGEFFDNLATGPLVIRRGSWDILPNDTCCTQTQWLSVEAGQFTIEAKGLPDRDYWKYNRPD